MGGSSPDVSVPEPTPEELELQALELEYLTTQMEELERQSTLQEYEQQKIMAEESLTAAEEAMTTSSYRRTGSYDQTVLGGYGGYETGSRARVSAGLTASDVQTYTPPDTVLETAQEEAVEQGPSDEGETDPFQEAIDRAEALYDRDYYWVSGGMEG